MKRVAVLGAGAWGTSIATVLAPRLEVTLWARDAAQAQAMARTRRNERYLPGVTIPETVKITSEFPSADLLLAATPVSGLRDVVKRIDKQSALVWLCKGFEQGSGQLPHQIVEQPRCGALSGPSFADEVARGMPCALTLASRDPAFARDAAAALHGGRMRVYYSTDLVGVEVGGAVKNVMAIAAGISDGLGLGHNARAALITRGLAEIARLGAAMGGQADTIFGLTGAGDLILTATGDLSRNRRVGLALAAGQKLDEILKSLGHVAEGVYTAREVAKLAKARGVDTPITAAVNDVLDGKLTPKAAVEQLLSRDLKQER